jgi:hypothetical protein
MMVGSIDRTTGRGGRAQNAAESVGVSECMHGADAVPRIAHQGRKMASWGSLAADLGDWVMISVPGRGADPRFGTRPPRGRST